MEPAVVDILDKAQIIALIAGVLLPFLVAVLTKARASGAVKALVAFVCAGLLALATYLGDVEGAATWKGALSVFVIAVITAAGSRVTLTGGADTALNNATGNVGVG